MPFNPGITYRRDFLSLYQAYVKRGRVFTESGNRKNLVYLVEHPIDGGAVMYPGGKLFLASKLPFSKENFSGPQTGLVEVAHVDIGGKDGKAIDTPHLDDSISHFVPSFYEIFVKFNNAGTFSPIFRVTRRNPSTGRVLGEYSLKDLEEQIKRFSD